MGGLFSHKAKVILIGLDNSGKTSILNKLMDPQKSNREITPTVGYQMEQVSRNGVDFEVYDMSGEQKYRDLWANYINKIQGIIYVVDISDRIRLGVAYSEIETILEDKNLPYGIPILVYANKADLKTAVDLKEVTEILHLKELKQNWKIFKSIGVSGTGVEEGMDWFSKEIKENFERKAT